MDPIRPVTPASRSAQRWLERRRRHLTEQLSAAEREDWGELERLLEEGRQDEAPPEGALDEAEARVLLEEAEALTQRLGDVRRRLLRRIEDTPRSESDLAEEASRVRRGHRLDGYL